MTQHPLLNLVAAAGLLIGPELLHAQATRPAMDWAGSYYTYDRPDKLMIEETTPTQEQLAFRGRPPQVEDDLRDSPKAKPLTMGQIDVRRLRFRDTQGDIVPALLCTPKSKAGPFPLAIAVHGLGSNKAQVCGQLAPALIRQGFAVLAPDMPVHGERPGDPREVWQKKDWLRAIELHRRAVIDIRECIDVAESRPELDLSRGIVLAGYSMGSWLDSVVGPLDERVKAMVLMVGGATDAAPFLRMLPQLALVDPLQALPHFAGRPLLMLNGKFDSTVTPEMAERLYDAAPQPKEQKWYDSGHHLPEGAYEDAAKWIARTWQQLTDASEPTTDQATTSRPMADAPHRTSSHSR